MRSYELQAMTLEQLYGARGVLRFSKDPGSPAARRVVAAEIRLRLRRNRDKMLPVVTIVRVPIRGAVR